MNLKLPALLGIPLIVPVENERPGGRVPLDDQKHAPVHPVALKVCEYAELIVQSGSVAGLTVIEAFAVPYGLHNNIANMANMHKRARRPVW
jgi:hypothetical protein